MPGLTVTEKSHWRDRIAKAVERIKARKPALFDRIAREAHAQALTSLGLADAYAELEAIKAEEALLARRKKQAQRSMVATLRSVPIDEVGDTFSVRYGGELGLALLSKLREEDGRPGVGRPSQPSFSHQCARPLPSLLRTESSCRQDPC